MSASLKSSCRRTSTVCSSRSTSPAESTASACDGKCSPKKRRSRCVDADRLVKSMYEDSVNYLHGTIDLHLPNMPTALNALQFLDMISVKVDKRQSNAASKRTQLMAAGASITIAKHFTDYERRCGWVPKADMLEERILQGTSPACQSIGKHVQAFVTTELRPRTNQDCNTTKVDAAIRQGTKLIILEHVGQAAGLPQGLSLLAAQQFRHLSRLSYAKFPDVLRILKTDASEHQRLLIQQYCMSHGPDWIAFLNRFHVENETSYSEALTVSDFSPFPEDDFTSATSLAPTSSMPIFDELMTSILDPCLASYAPLTAAEHHQCYESPCHVCIDCNMRGADVHMTPDIGYAWDNTWLKIE